ncbi:MAG: OmpA family protein [Bacteroidia bacterium]|nr:OmpA family protein [Bacteroidia bacterium]
MVIRIMVFVAATTLLASCVSKKKYEEAMTRAAAEKSALESSLASAQDENAKLKADAEELQKNLNMSKEEIAALSKTVADNNARLAEMKSAISAAFETYDPNDFSIEERNGKLYISMQNKILFEAGRDRLLKDSESIIATMAETFKKNQGMYVAVEGHTDSDPVVVNKAKFKDNWSLSVARSISVVRELEKNGVSSDRLTATGKGDTQPVAANDSDEGKEKNRRTEFVIAPKVDGLYKMYKSGFGGSGSSN